MASLIPLAAAATLALTKKTPPPPPAPPAPSVTLQKANPPVDRFVFEAKPKQVTSCGNLECSPPPPPLPPYEPKPEDVVVSA